MTPRISVHLTDAAGRTLFARDADRPYYAASTMKLAVLLAATTAVADGRASLTDELPASRTFTGAGGAPFALEGDHLDHQLPAEGTPMSLAEMLGAMITRSSNEATNSVMELLGVPAVAAVPEACGTRNTRIERLIGDPSAVEGGLTNETTAADLTMLLRATVTGRFGTTRLPDDLVARQVDWLERQTIAPIAAGLPKGVRHGSKSGEVEGFRHDVAFVGDPGAADVRYLAVCTSGLAEAAADEVIAAVTEALLLRMRSPAR
ncbi:serine hydrolase [Janibacter corallicola]|uniref:serine hydrolase n=1 Tax=Janibacter corallicola TaxID=415212 RepID=UPI00082FF3B3|nr:serine hydrolase [Janibacter corallicola]